MPVSSLFSGVPFFLKSDGANGSGRALPMSANGARHRATLGAPMTLWNDQAGASSGVPMFIKGNGATDGYFPASSSMPLHLRRWPTAEIMFVAAGPGAPASGSFPGFVGGKAPASGGLTLACGAAGGVNTSVSFRVRGL